MQYLNKVFGKISEVFFPHNQNIMAILSTKLPTV